MGGDTGWDCSEASFGLGVCSGCAWVFFLFGFVLQLQGENSVASQVTHFRATFLFTVEMTIQDLLCPLASREEDVNNAKLLFLLGIQRHLAP